MRHLAGLLGPLTCLLLAWQLFQPHRAEYLYAAFDNEDTSYAGLTLIVAVLWGLSRLRDLPTDLPTPPRPRYRWLVAATVFLPLGYLLDLEPFSLLALLSLGHFALSLLYAPDVFATLAGPRHFSLLAIPVPKSLLFRITDWLKPLIAKAAGQVLTLLGQPNVVMGARIVTEQASILVVPACSGFRTLVVTAVFAIGIALHRRLTVWRGLFLLALVPVVALVTNILRVVVTTLLAGRGFPFLVEGGGHLLLGLVFDLPGFFFLALLSDLLRPWERRSGRTSGQRPAVTVPGEISPPSTARG